MKINILDSKVFNRISAGEVVEKPASVVKEMVENSIDAGADTIIVEIFEGGTKKIVITDNGCGISKEDLKNAFLPHATSKIKNVEDLDNIATLGFRGEALASIASVSHVFLSSRSEDEEIGYCLNVDGGVFGEIKEIARNNGTTFEVCDLFYNTPVRAKFMRKPKSEESEITHLIQKFMLAHPEIAFCYMIDGKQIYNTTSTELSDIIYTIYGKEVYDNLLEVDYKEGNICLKGYIVAPKLSKTNRTYQTLFVNGRYVENYLVSSAIQGVYESFLMKGRFPIYVLNIIVPTDSVDVNVHPTKKEVKFENSNFVFGFIHRAIEKSLVGADHIPSSGLVEEEVSFIERQSEFNREGFGYIPLRNNEPLSSTEGSSYVRSYDTELAKKKFDAGDFEIQEKEIITKVLPNFNNITVKKELPVNSDNGNIFFDQSQACSVDDIINNREVQSAEKIFRNATRDDMKLIGVLFNTYIVVELYESIFLVDQHAAHERLLYDRLVNRVDGEETVKQSLLFPYMFSVNEKEKEIVERSLPMLMDLGFEIEKNSRESYNINAIPAVLEGLNLSKFVESLLSDQEIWVKKNSEIIKDKLAQNACKHAIKGGDKLSLDQLADLIEQMKQGLLLCPHGRPTVIEITRKELEKMFKRII